LAPWARRPPAEEEAAREEEVVEEDLLSRQRVGESIKRGGGEGEGGELPGRTKREKSFRKKEKRVGKKASEEEQGIHPVSGVVINSGSEPRASGALATTTVHCLSLFRSPPLFLK